MIRLTKWSRDRIQINIFCYQNNKLCFYSCSNSFRNTCVIWHYCYLMSSGQRIMMKQYRWWLTVHILGSIFMATRNNCGRCLARSSLTTVVECCWRFKTQTRIVYIGCFQIAKVLSFEKNYFFKIHFKTNLEFVEFWHQTFLKKFKKILFITEGKRSWIYKTGKLVISACKARHILIVLIKQNFEFENKG